MRLRGCCSGRWGGGGPAAPPRPQRPPPGPACARGEGGRAGERRQKGANMASSCCCWGLHIRPADPALFPPPARPRPVWLGKMAVGAARCEAEAAAAAAIPFPPPARPHLRSRQPHRGWSSAPSY